MRAENLALRSHFAVVGFSATRHEVGGGDQETRPRRTEVPRVPPGWEVPWWLALDGSATAINGDYRASDVARTRRGEEADDFGNLFDVRSAVEQCGGPERFDERVFRGSGVHWAGAMAFTRTPLRPNSAAQARVIDESAAFVAPKAAPFASPI